MAGLHVTIRARIRRTLEATVALALAGALRPTPADAHLVTTGLGPIYDGISHVLLSPDDLVPVLAMALLAGLNGPTAGRRTLLALTGAWLVGGIGGYLTGAAGPPGTATAAASFLLLGVLTAADRRLSPSVLSALAAAVGLLHGWFQWGWPRRGPARGADPVGYRRRHLRAGRDRGSLRGVAAGVVGSRRGTRGRKLGGGHWLADARLVAARSLRPATPPIPAPPEATSDSATGIDATTLQLICCEESEAHVADPSGIDGALKRKRLNPFTRSIIAA